MSRALLVLSVMLSSYAVVSTLASIAIVAAWRTLGLDRCTTPASARSRQIALIRVFPAAAGILLTVALVMPGYLAFEVPSPYEDVGPLLVALAAAGGVLIAAGLGVGLRAAIATRQLERRWMRSAAAIDLAPPAGMPAFAIDTQTPVVALVGVSSPKLFASRSVIEACDDREIESIVSHERGHLAAHDNLTRCLIASAPDALRWTRFHDHIATTWHDAAEDAADDAATGGERVARANLAALLLKVARLAPNEQWAPAMVSAFADPRSLDRRVRRLLEDATDGAPNLIQRFARTAALAAVAMVTLSVTNTAILRGIHHVVEAVVGFGR